MEDFEEKVRSLGMRQATLLPLDAFAAHIRRREKCLAKVNLPMPATAFPSSFSLEAYAPPVYDQAQLGSCVANATGANLQMCGLHPNPSRLFIYTTTRMAEAPQQSPPQDDGSDAMDIPCSTIGIAEEQYMPYTVDSNGQVPGFGSVPSQAAYQNALTHRCPNLVNITSADLVNTLKSALLGFIPVEMAFLVFSSFMTQAVATSGFAPLPSATDKLVGGHEVLALAWDDSKQAFLFQNSWSSNWGIKGRFWLPYSYFQGKDATYGDWVSQLTIFPNAHVPSKPSPPAPTPSTDLMQRVEQLEKAMAQMQKDIAALERQVFD